MSKRKIVVPDGMMKAHSEGFISAFGAGETVNQDDLHRAGLESAMLWLLNDIGSAESRVLSDDLYDKRPDRGKFPRDDTYGVILNFFNTKFPEVGRGEFPEAIRHLWSNVDGYWNKAVLEAYRLGKGK